MRERRGGGAREAGARETRAGKVELGEVEARKTRSGGKSQTKTGQTGSDQKRPPGEIIEAQAKELYQGRSGGQTQEREEWERSNWEDERRLEDQQRIECA